MNPTAEPQQQMVYELEQAEMLGLMAAVQTSLIVGIDNAQLVPNGQKAQQEMALQGLQQLRDKGWLTPSTDEDGLELLDANLGMMMPALAYPEMMLLVTRDAPGQPQQQFRYYRANPVQLALEMPAPNQYRLVGILDAVAMLNAARSHLPVTEEPTTAVDSFSLPLDAFMAAKDLAEQGNVTDAAAQFEAAGCSATGATTLAQAINQPTVGGTMAFLQFEDQQIVNGRNLVMVRNETAAWMVQPREDNPELLAVQTATPESYSAVLLANARAVS